MSVHAPTLPRLDRRSGTAATVTARGTLGDWVEARALFIVGVCVVVTLVLAGIPDHLDQDGWLALAAGRLIAGHGIPQHDYFTQMAYGARWVDQQWLAQLVMYWLDRLGGLQLFTVACVGVVGVAFAGAIASARRLGGQDLHVLVALPVAVFFFLVTAVSIRTQELAYPLFVATLYLLASDVRSATRRGRTWLVLPILALWANVHGSVTMGVGLAIVYACAITASAARQFGLRRAIRPRAVAFTLLAPLTLLATPYGTGIVHYYRVTLLNPRFSSLVTEWRPSTSIPLMAGTLLPTIVAVAVILWRGRHRTPLFDQAVLAMLAIGALIAVRNVTWFGLAATMLVPAALSARRPGRAAGLRRARTNRILAFGAVALMVGVGALVLTRPARWFTSQYPGRAVSTLRRIVARDPGVKIFADIHYADWLVWSDPSTFAGRVAYDTSLELLSARQLHAIAAVSSPHPVRAHTMLASYGIWVLDPVNHRADGQLTREPGVHAVMRNRRVLIVTHVGS